MDKLIKANTRTLRSPLWTSLTGVHMDQEDNGITIIELRPYLKWLKKLPALDKGKIQLRLDMIKEGFFVDCKPVGETIYEMRFHSGSGIRVYFSKRQDNTVVLLLIGGKKDTQDADIKKAEKLNKEFKDGDY